jgi:hypothetical protein
MMRDRILHLADLHLGDPHDYLGDRGEPRGGWRVTIRKGGPAANV